MADTSLSLGEHWESFIKKEVASGRYGSASEVVRDGLRALEDRNLKLETLRKHLKEGELQIRESDTSSQSASELLMEFKHTKAPYTK